MVKSVTSRKGDEAFFDSGDHFSVKENDSTGLYVLTLKLEDGDDPYFSEGLTNVNTFDTLFTVPFRIVLLEFIKPFLGFLAALFVVGGILLQVISNAGKKNSNDGDDDDDDYDGIGVTVSGGHFGGCGGGGAR